MKIFTCKLCNKVFTKETRSYCFYCKECRKIKNREASLKHAYKTGRTKHPGVGSGGAQYKEDNHRWSNYKAEYSYRHLKILDKCERCNSTRFLVRHHKDFDRSNNIEENIEILCRRCHAKEHKLIKNLPKQNLVNSGEA